MHTALTRRIISLARRTDICEDDWYVLLHERYERLKEYLRGMTLNKMGSLNYLYDYFHEHSLGRDEPNQLDGMPQFSLETRGIFPPDRNEKMMALKTGFSTSTYRDKGRECRKTKPYDGLVFGTSVGRFWGLTRNGEWLGVEVRSDHLYEQYKYDDRFEEVEKARTISIREMPLPELCTFVGVTPRDIWDRLGEVVETWVKDRRHLLSTAEQIHDFFEREKDIVNIISPRRS